jgi:hypothetical protein
LHRVPERAEDIEEGVSRGIDFLITGLQDYRIMDDKWARPSMLTSAFLTLCLMVFLSIPKSQAQVYELKCDGLHNPLGVESLVPHFSWKNTLTHN